MGDGARPVSADRNDYPPDGITGDDLTGQLFSRLKLDVDTRPGAPYRVYRWNPGVAVNRFAFAVGGIARPVGSPPVWPYQPMTSVMAGMANTGGGFLAVFLPLPVSLSPNAT